MHNITNYPVLQWTPLAISNEREEIALLVVSPAAPPDGGIERGEEGERRHWRIKCLLSSLTQKCNLQQEKMFGSSSVPNVFNHPVSLSLPPPGKVAQCMTEQGKNWPGMNESVFVILSSNGR